MEWNYIQQPEYENYSLNERNGFIRLKGSSETIRGQGSPTFVGRRLQDINFTATTQLEFEPKNDNEEAGITLVNNRVHFDLMILTKDKKRFVQVKLQFGPDVYKSNKIQLNSGPVKLRVKGDNDKFIFSYAQKGEEFKEIDLAATSYLSSETVGGFTGVYIGLYATGNGKNCKAAADYDWFEYSPDKNTRDFAGFWESINFNP